MNDKQQDAINDLELAFAKAKRAGLLLLPVYGGMCAYDARAIDEHRRDGASLYDAQRAMHEESVKIDLAGVCPDLCLS